MPLFDNPAIKALGSLRLSLWLLAGQLMLFLAGAVVMPKIEAFRSINSMALLDWMRMEAPPSASWWLWASVGLMALLALNTLICSLEAIVHRRANRPWMAVLAPQVIHLGFMLMMLAHLLSALSATHQSFPMPEGSAISLPGGDIMRLSRVNMTMSPEGYPLNWSAELEYYSADGEMVKKAVASPNNPHFFKGIGAYIKQPASGGALIEVHREPGTPWALAGGALFILGTLALTAIKTGRERD